MKRVFRRPSPAMVVAIVALIAALGGTAIGAAFVTKKQSKKIAANQVNKLAPGLSVASAKNADTANNSNQLEGRSLRGIQMWVLLGSTGVAPGPGTIVSSSGGVSSQVLGIGRARVTFPNPVNNCGINANGGSSSAASDATNFADGFVMFGRSSTGPNDVQYEVDDAAANPVATEPVFMTVNC